MSEYNFASRVFTACSRCIFFLEIPLTLSESIFFLPLKSDPLVFSPTPSLSVIPVPEYLLRGHLILLHLLDVSLHSDLLVAVADRVLVIASLRNPVILLSLLSLLLLLLLPVLLSLPCLSLGLFLSELGFGVIILLCEVELIGSFRLLHENKLVVFLFFQDTTATAEISLHSQVVTGESFLLNVCEDGWGGQVVDCSDEAEVDKRDR